MSTSPRLLGPLACAAALMLSAVPALAKESDALCAASSRECLVKTTMRYLDGLSRHQGAGVPLARDVRVTEQGKLAVTGDKALRAELDGSSAITALRNVRLTVDEATGQVAGFLLIDVAKPSAGAASPYTVRRAQRFKIVRGLITEVEIINYTDPKLAGLAPPLWPD